MNHYSTGGDTTRIGVVKVRIPGMPFAEGRLEKEPIIQEMI